MSLGEIEELIKDSEPAVRGKKQTLFSTLNDHAHDSNPSVAVHCRTDRGDGEGNCGGGAVDSGSALRLFLDHVPISSIPGIRNTPVLELKTGDTLRDAIDLLYEKNVSGAPIADAVDPEATVGSHRFTDQYIGFIDFARLVLWSLEKYEKDHTSGTEGEGGDNEASVDGIFTMLEQNPQIGQAKVGELAKSFLLDPFFPVNLDDTLFHVLLLLSKHRLQVVPVMEQPNSRVIGFITQV